MDAEGDSFLPRIQSVFYAAFDLRQGPKIIYQVPEGLIAVPPGPTPDPSTSQVHLIPSPDLTSPRKRSISASKTLFNFDDISKYVIPPSPLCGRLVVCPTRNHRVIGFPVELRGNYERYYFRYNICFVFNRSADLSCYEPVVRKVSRVLTACEEESAFLSNPETSTTIHHIIEQLYEDLNSYSETSIQIDRFNSIELKILPFYPNPPPVYDWQVPVALINLTKRIQPNWDLTMVKICKLIDGVSHVSRIAHFADCDLELTRQAICHLLHYQVLMMIDLFQYSNMYTLRSSIQWLADEPHVIDECGPYVTKPGWSIPDWPKLLHLYSRLKPGRTIFEWIHDYDVNSLGIDVRRFTSFGVIKGFLRRVHRWPVLLPQSDSTPASLERRPSALKRRSSFGASPSPGRENNPLRIYVPRGRQSIPAVTAVTMERKTSAAENALEMLKFKHQRDRTGSNASTGIDESHSVPVQGSIGDYSHHHHQQHQRLTTISSSSSNISSAASLTLPLSPSVPSSQFPHGSMVSTFTKRPNFSRSPSAPVVTQRQSNVISATSNLPLTARSVPSSNLIYPPELTGLLDGEHHTDDLATRFEVGWSLLEKWLADIGGGSGDGDLGRVFIIYR